MYQLIIVDDEKVIRNGIRDYIDWKSMGFEVADTFEDGKEALQYLKVHEVDVVLTDIEMAEISGLEIASQIKENGWNQRVVIISGYKEFEYARKAVEYGVEYYLLKPIRMEEVKEVFTKLARELDMGRAKREEELHAEKDFTELLPELREQFWTGLLIGGTRSRESIEKKIKVLGMSVKENAPYAIVDLRLSERRDSFPDYYEGENFHNMIHNICGGEMEGIISIPVCISEDIVKVVLTTIEDIGTEEFLKLAEKQMAERCEAADSLLQIKFHAEIEQVFPDIMGLAEYQCVFTKKGVSTGGEYLELSAEDYERLMQKYKLLMGIINDGDFEELDNLINNIFHEFRSMPVVQVQKLCIDMFSMLSGKLVCMGIDMWKVWNRKLSYQEFTSTQDLRVLKEKAKELLHDVVRMMKDKQNVGSRHFVEESIKYMKKHYSEEISLEVIANKFFLNQTYFSRLFKQYTGTTFTDYLIELRMEQAKELLNQGKYKVYEISQMVGYRSEKYFFRIFKQYAGCSPTEYYRRKQLDE